MKQREHLIHMANQIAANFATMGEQEAAAATADHIISFWDPRMKAAILEQAAGLSPIATAAIDRLRVARKPAGVTPATDFGSAAVEGGSDAG